MTALLTYCACIDPRRINPSTGHYPGCPDSIIPPDQLLPPWEVVTREEATLEGRGPRSVKYPEGKPIFGKRYRTELAPGKAWAVSVAPTPEAPPALSAPSVAPALTSDPDAILCVLDTETTGLRKAGTVVGVCEIALCVVDLSADSGGAPRVIARHAKLLNPGMRIPPDATRVHHITDAMVKGEPHLADIFPRIVEWMRMHCPSGQIVAHSAPYDREVIADVLRARGIPLPPWHWRCSMALAKRVTPGLPSYSLHDSPGKTGLATSLSLTRGESHRAMGDVITTVSLLGALRARAGDWSAWRGEAVSWAGKAVAGAPEQSVAVTPTFTPAEPAAAAIPPPATPVSKPAKPQRKPARAVPQGPSLFDLLQEQGPAVAERKSAS